MSEISAKYDQLIQDLRRDYRPQREWGEGRGLFLVVGHFLVGVAAGTWLLGLIFDHLPGLLAAFVLAGAGGLAHLAFLGRPDRFWRMVRHVRTSWISRGFVGLSLFLVGAALHLAPLVFAGWVWAPDSAVASIGWAMAVIGMLVLIGYMGFVYTASKGIPFWGSALHPVLYVAYAVRGGVAALLVTMALFSASPAAAVTTLTKIWIAVTVVVIILYALEIHGALYGGNPAARRSARDLLLGRVAVSFYGGTLLIGLAVPSVLVSGTIAPIGLTVLVVIGVFSALGDFFMKYTTIRAGVYLPPPRLGRPR